MNVLSILKIEGANALSKILDENVLSIMGMGSTLKTEQKFPSDNFLPKFKIEGVMNAC